MSRRGPTPDVLIALSRLVLDRWHDGVGGDLDAAAINLVVHADGVSVTDLARQLGLSHSATMRVVDRLESRRLLADIAGRLCVGPGDPDAPLFGGGTDNIAFLLGDPTAAAPNANAIQMSAIFWIETVSEQITVPAYTSTQPVIIQGSASAGDPVASFAVSSATEITADTQIEVTYTQIQYTQRCS